MALSASAAGRILRLRIMPPTWTLEKGLGLPRPRPQSNFGTVFGYSLYPCILDAELRAAGCKADAEMVTEPNWRVPLVFRRTPQIQKGSTPMRYGTLDSIPLITPMKASRQMK